MATQTIRTYPHMFMQRVTSSNKSKQVFSNDEIAQVLAKEHELTLLKDKGLFLEIISTIIRRQFVNFELKLHALKLELFPVIRAERKKRQPHDEDDDVPRRKRNKKQGKAADIKNLVDQASSNPSNVLPLTSEQIRLNQDKEKEDASKGSKPSSKDNQIPPLDDGFVGQITAFDAQGQITTHLQQPPESDNSNNSSQSSSILSGIIPNLSQKLKILGGDVSFEGKRNASRRTNATVTRKKGRVDHVDDNITLNDTRETVSRKVNLDLTLNYIKERAKEMQKMQAYVFFTKAVDQIDRDFRKRLNNTGNAVKCKSFGLKIKGRRGGDDFRHPEIGQYYENEMPQNQNTDIVPSNYTQLPNTDFAIYKQHLEGNIFSGNIATNLTEMARATKKSKGEVFTNMLFLCQRGEVRMKQQNPQKFGQIQIERLVLEEA